MRQNHLWVFDFPQAQEDREQVRDYRDNKQPEVQPQLEASQTSVELLKAVPDIDTKQKELREYALEVMGYSPAELESATNLANGVSAVREIVRINNAYERHVAPQKAQAKAIKKKPTKVEKSGGGFEKNETTNKDRIAHAKKSGNAADWMDVFMNMED